ncbi:MAG: Lpg1974 family pore-forming outer membrane protein [Chlamydiota bacterium]
MKFNFKAVVFFMMLFMSNIALASTGDNEADVQEKNGYFLQQRQDIKKECHYISKCRCSDYKTCCPMLPLPNKNGYVFFAGEYLFWKAYTEIPYAILKYAAPPFLLINSSEPFNQEVESTELNAHSGYRINLGIYLSKNWLFLGTLRQFQAHGANGISTGGDPTDDMPVQEKSWIDMVWMSNNPANLNFNQGAPVSANATQRYRETVFDVDFLRSFICNRFTFNPFLGVRFAWLKADLRVDYLLGSSNDTQGNLPLPFTNHVDIANHMNLGVGLHAGLSSNIKLCWGFGVNSKIALAPLIGQFQYAHKEDVVDSSDRPTSTYFQRVAYTTNRSFKVTNFQTNWELGVDLNWGRHFQNCKYYLDLKVGYDVSVWPRFFTAIRQSEYRGDDTNVSLQMPNQTDLMSSWTESLLTHGLKLGARIDF